MTVRIHSSDGEEIDITGMKVGLISADTDTDRFVGLYNKYQVYLKADADSDLNLAHCDLFVLDQSHDPFSYATLVEYMGGDHDLDLKQPYTVIRLNDKTNKHKDCDFFVLNLTTDERARKAAAKYVELCRKDYPALAHELSEKILRNTVNGQKQGWGRQRHEGEQQEQTPEQHRSEGSTASEAGE